jgi:ubiquitin-like protein Pup
MSKQEHVQKKRTRVTKNTRTEVIDEDKRTRSAKEAEALKEEMDDLLDEIDGVLEENAEEFIQGYVQKGGQ